MSSFVQKIQEIGLQKKPENWLSSYQAGSLNRLTVQGLPSSKDEMWKYTNLKFLDQEVFFVPDRDELEESEIRTRIQELVSPEDQYVVCLNGRVCPEFSRVFDNSEVTSFREADDQKRQSIEEILTEPEQRESMTWLNEALFVDGLFFEIEDRQKSQTIHVFHMFQGQQNATAITPFRIIVKAKPFSQVSVVEHYMSLNEYRALISCRVDLVMEAGAYLNHCRNQALNSQSYVFCDVQVRMSKDSNFYSFLGDTGSKLARNNLRVKLNEPGAYAWLDGLYFAYGSQHIDNQTQVLHMAADCGSHQLYKGILAEKGRGVFNGQIYVEKGAQRTDSSQLNKNLLLSSMAEVDTKPNLEIFADDVKCAHGATVGQIDEDALFYLQARGITRAKALEMLSRGFVEEILNRVRPSDFSQRLRASVDQPIQKISELQ